MGLQKILIVDDDKLLRNFLKDTLTNMGKQITLATCAKEAISFLNKETFDLVLTDAKLKKDSGLDVLDHIREKKLSVLCIIMTAYGSIEDAVTATKKGAFQYLIKPFSIEAIESALQKAQEHLFLVAENDYLKKIQIIEKPHSQFICNSPIMQEVCKNIAKIAQSNASVFITGESGTGKERIAEKIHMLSPRNELSFVKVNCAAIPETLLEAEFFGHEKGAFTGAITQREGRFEKAHKGTLFLDEVTEIPLSLQPKLLRAIQEKEFERIGSNHPIQVDIRFVATSNRSMKEAVEKNIFRKDLFYRLNVVPIHLPPLRERKEDILPLAMHFLEKFSLENNKKNKILTKEAKQLLLQYPFPGNVRELANMMERIVVLDRSDKIQKEDLVLESFEKKSFFKSKSLREIEAKHILKTLRMQNFNKQKTAKILGITTRTLRNKLKQFNNEPEK